MADKAVAVVTGAAGFCGQHLVKRLKDRSYQVVALDRKKLPVASLDYHHVDVNDREKLSSILRETRPHLLFHLAGLTNPNLSYEELHGVNAMGTLSLLSTAREACPNARILIVSSSAVYGKATEDELPISERSPFRPYNSYALSKLAQEMIGYQHFLQFGMPIVTARPFNLTGPGEHDHFVISAFARQLVEMELGERQPRLHVGNLSPVRDFTDVRDAVDAYAAMAEKGRVGAAYNVCSGVGRSIQSVVDQLLHLCHLKGIRIEVDKERVRKSDVSIQVGDDSRIREQTGWQLQYSFERTLNDVLNSWRKKLHV